MQLTLQLVYLNKKKMKEGEDIINIARWHLTIFFVDNIFNRGHCNKLVVQEMEEPMKENV